MGRGAGTLAPAPPRGCLSRYPLAPAVQASQAALVAVFQQVHTGSRAPVGFCATHVTVYESNRRLTSSRGLVAPAGAMCSTRVTRTFVSARVNMSRPTMPGNVRIVSTAVLKGVLADTALKSRGVACTPRGTASCQSVASTCTPGTPHAAAALWSGARPPAHAAAHLVQALAYGEILECELAARRGGRAPAPGQHLDLSRMARVDRPARHARDGQVGDALGWRVGERVGGRAGEQGRTS